MQHHPPSAVRGDLGLWTVWRPRLIDCLDEATQRPLTLIVAPVGFGKRTLLDQWTSTHEGNVHRLDGAAMTPQSVRAIARRQTQSLLVVDDTHQTSPDSLDALLDLLDSGTRIVLSGLSRPPIALGSLTARGMVTELTATDLALTRDETRVLLETAGHVPDQALDLVMETSAGWPVTLRILAEQELSRERAPSQLERLYAFFDEAVHAMLSPDELDLVRAIAVLPSVNPGVTTSLTGDPTAYRTLTSLVGRGYPITRQGTALALHPMVRRQIIEQLKDCEPASHRELAGKGIDWLVSGGQPLAAIELALESGAADGVGDLLRETFLHHLFTDPDRLRPLVRACAAEGHLPTWEAALMQASLVAAEGDVATGFALATVQRLAEDDPTPLDRLRIAGLTLFLARQNAYADARLAQTLDPGHPADLPPECLGALALWQVERGLHLLHSGDLAGAQQFLIDGLTTARLCDLRSVAVQALAARAFVMARRGGVAAARRLADEAILELATLDPSMPTPLVELAWLAHAMVDIDLADFDSASEHLDAFRRCSLTPRRETAVIAAQLEAMYHLMRGEEDACVRLVERSRQRLSPLLAAEDFMLAATACAAHLMTSDTAAARREVERIEAVARPEFGPIAHLRAHLIMRNDQFEEAFALLDPIVAEGDVVVEKEWLQLLMSYALAADRSGRTGIAVATFAAADGLAARLGMDDPRARQNLGTVERRARVQFTEAEMHLLRNLTPEGSIAELAERLFISPNTVKTHLRRIYRKLSVSSRTEAIERARVLRLL